MVGSDQTGKLCFSFRVSFQISQEGKQMQKKENSNGPQTGKVKFGILPKLLLGILVPLFVVLGIMGIFLGIQGTNTVDETMSENLDSQTKAAAAQVESFF